MNSLIFLCLVVFLVTFNVNLVKYNSSGLIFYDELRTKPIHNSHLSIYYLQKYFFDRVDMKTKRESSGYWFQGTHD